MNTKQIDKLKEILQAENAQNYSQIKLMKRGFVSSDVISHRERILARIERAVFGKADIQKKEFVKLCKEFPEYKNGMFAYKNR